MRVHSWGQASGVCGTQAVSGSQPQPSAPDGSQSSDCTTQVAFSKQTALIQKLTALQSSDPASFKQVAGRVAEHFQQRAAFAQGSDADTLSQLAVTFASAAQTGDLSAFQALSGPAAAPPPSAPPAPPPKPPIDALATALSMVDSITGTSSASGSESFQQLTELKASSPAGLKQVMNGVAEGLSQLAHFAEGDDKEALAQMSTRFASAAESGDISSFAPPSSGSVAPPPVPPGPPPKPPIDALATAFSLVDSITGSSSASSSESVQQLNALKSANPASFKQLMNGVAEGLSQLAHFAEGDDKEALAQMSTRFASVAESGDVSSFAPAAAPAAPSEPPPAPPGPPPVDTVATAFSVVDELTGTSSASSSEALQKLTDLKASNPSQLKTVLNRVAERLNQLSNFAEGADRDALSQFANRVASAAESGDLSPFAPPAPAPAEPEPTPEPAPQTNPQAAGAEACSQFRNGYAHAAYRRQCEPAPLNAVDATFASALSLVNSLTAQNA